MRVPAGLWEAESRLGKLGMASHTRSPGAVGDTCSKHVKRTSRRRDAWQSRAASTLIQPPITLPNLHWAALDYPALSKNPGEMQTFARTKWAWV